MHQTDRILENLRKEVELYGRSGPDCVFKTNISFSISNKEFHVPTDCDFDGACQDFDWFVRCEDHRMWIAHPDPDSSWLLKHFDSDALPYGITWDFPLLFDTLRTPEKWRQAILFNPQHLRVPSCILAYQFQEVDWSVLDVTITLRSSDIAKVLPQDVMMTRLLLEKVATTLGKRVGTMTFNMGNAHIYYEDLEWPDEFTDDVGR